MTFEKSDPFLLAENTFPNLYFYKEQGKELGKLFIYCSSNS